MAYRILTVLIIGILFSSINLTAQSIRNIAQDILLQNLQTERLELKDIENFEITHEHVSSLSGIQHIYIRQRIANIPVYKSVGGIHIDKDGNLVAFDNQFERVGEQKINTSSPQLSAIEAVKSAAKQLDYNFTEPIQILEKKQGLNPKFILSSAGISLENIPAQLMYQKMKDGSLRLSWDISILEKDAQNWWSMRVDAVTGEILNKNNWMVKCEFGHSDGSNGHTCDEEKSFLHNHSNHNHSPIRTKSNSVNPDSYNVYPLGIESPSHGGRTIEVDPADLTASPFGWHDTDGNAGAEYTITRGNNVHAQEDQNANNGTGASPDAGTSLDFDYPIDFSQQPTTTDNQNAAITNLFYWNNIMHDVWYQYGFDEASGNFQENNYGNGGAASDFVFADAQDGGGLNNANFGTPADGSSPRMQMFLWSPSSSNPLTVNSPAAVAGNYNMVVASFGPSTFNVTGDLVLVDDGTGSPTEGCNTLVNGADLNGNIAVVDRGGCQFGVKCLNAQNEGAIAVIVCDNAPGSPISMGPGTDGASVTIPSVMISQADCATIRVEIPTVNVTMDVSTSAIELDGDLDNGIIAHEYGHGISTRLTGGAGNSGCLGNNEQMGEGWSDYFGLMLTTNSSDLGTDVRGIGTYALGEPTNGGGIRPFPYSTDMGINPHTYNDISGVSIPHGVGSVWCMMLWEMTWELVAEYGWDDDYYNGTGGNNISMALVTEALKLQPCNPGFVDGRDAILAADQVLYGGANQCRIWTAFAKRGLGFGASQGNSDNVNDSVESYDIAPSCTINFTKTSDITQASPGEVITYTLTVTNSTSNTFTNVVITDPIPENTTYVAGSASNSGTESGGVVTFPGVTLNPSEVFTVTFQVLVDLTLEGGLFDFTDDVENGNNDWTTTATNAGLSNWEITTTNPNGGTSHWFAEDVPSPNDQYLTISDVIVPSTGCELSFFHSYDTEEDWDGGRVEVSTDGITWTDLGSLMTQNGYNGILDNSASSPGFSGNSNGYLETIIDLNSYAGQSIQIRFFMHCDAAVGGDGWYIDDITINDLELVIPNTATVTTDGGLVNTASLINPTMILEATCSDGIQNGDETEIDCGGTTCNACTDPCPENEIYTGPITSGTYEVSNTITSSGEVGSNENVQFLANIIILEPNFVVQSNAEFTADIDPCVATFTGEDDEKLNDTKGKNIVEDLSKKESFYKKIWKKFSKKTSKNIESK